MTGKCVVYWIGRKGNRALPGRPGQALQRWRERLERQPTKAAVLVLLSSIVGLPPFYIMTLLAGAMKMNFPLFLTVGTAGRLLRFGVLVLLPHLAITLFQRGT
jgi:membrane protein YqaA with SNARE-associated domain